MSSLYKVLLYIHVLVGAASLVIFWIPIAARKGGSWHVRAGRWYTKAMTIVAFTALVIAIMLVIDPVGVKAPASTMNMQEAVAFSTQVRYFSVFLLALSVLVFSSVRHGLLTLHAKNNHSLMRAPGHIALHVLLGILGVGLVFLGAVAGQVLFYIFAGICIAGSIGNLRYYFKTTVKRMEWMIAHMGAMIGAGIGSYTAFFVFGGSRFFASVLEGNWVLVPWVLPSVIGVASITLLTRKYRSKFAVPQQSSRTSDRAPDR